MNSELLENVLPHNLKMTDPGQTPELSPRFTGKVIIVNEKGEHEALEGVQFSNIDLNWYDTEGQPHPDFDKYKGKKFGMQFTLTDMDKDRKEHAQKKIFLSQLVHGEKGPTDWKHIREAEKFEVDTAIEMGAVTGYDDPHLKDFLAGSSASIVIYTTPGLKWTEVKSAIALVSWGYAVDEIFDNNVFFKMHNIPFCQISQVTHQLMEAVNGSTDPENAEVDFDFPMLQPLCRYMVYLREQALLKSSTENFQRFVDGLRSYLNAVAISNCKEWNDYKASNKSGTALRAHWDIRRMNSGALHNFDNHLMVYGNRMSAKICESHLWKHFRSLCTDSIVFVNDLMSYEKEVFEGETTNALIVRHHIEGMDFLEAVAKCVDDANKAAMDIIEIGNVLLKIFDNDRELKEAIYLLKAMTSGHIQWYNYAFKYKGGNTFDQVIYMSDEVMLKQLNIK